MHDRAKHKASSAGAVAVASLRYETMILISSCGRAVSRLPEDLVFAAATAASESLSAGLEGIESSLTSYSGSPLRRIVTSLTP